MEYSNTMSIKSDFGEVNIPATALHEIIFSQFKHYGTDIALVDGVTGKEYTYNDVYRLCYDLANGLIELGLVPGEVVALYSYNSPHWVCMMLAVLAAGGTVMTVNPLYTKYELSNQIKDAGVHYVFTIKELVMNCLAVKDDVKTLKKIICNGQASIGCVSFDSLLCSEEGERNCPLPKVNVHDDVALILYSSGTTGIPKGVMLTHYNFVANLTQIGFQPLTDTNEPSEHKQTIMLSVLPMYHSYGLMLLCWAIATGSKVITLPKFEPKTFLSAIQRYKVENLPLVPPIVNFLAKSALVSGYDLSSIHDVTCGAAPLSKHTETEFKTKLQINVDFGQGYGMTETTCVACAQTESSKKVPGSCGKLLPSTEAKIIDVKSGKSLGPNETGEILLRGPQVMKGYLNNPKSTHEVLETDGWLHTGDLGYYDNDHNMYIIDRMKDLIKVKGFQVAPAELEAVLLSHPAVEDVGVVGVTDERAGQLPRAFVVTSQPTDVTKEKLHAYVAERLASFKQLKGGIQFVEEIPKLQSGKILRRKLKEM